VASLRAAASIQRLTGRVAVITGAAEGVGRAVALQLAKEGAAVVVVDSREDRLLQVTTELDKLKREYLAIPTEVTDEQSVARLIQKSLSHFKRIDVLVNGTSLRHPASVEDVTERIWNNSIRTNLVSVFLCSKAVVPTMLVQRHGRIISFTSREALGGSKNAVHDNAAKAGIIGFSKALALEVASFGITVNTICVDEHSEDSAARLELEQSGRHEEGVGSAVFLASDAASYVTGQMLVVNGVSELR